MCHFSCAGNAPIPDASIRELGSLGSFLCIYVPGFSFYVKRLVSILALCIQILRLANFSKYSTVEKNRGKDRSKWGNTKERVYHYKFASKILGAVESQRDSIIENERKIENNRIGCLKYVDRHGILWTKRMNKINLIFKQLYIILSVWL